MKLPDKKLMAKMAETLNDWIGRRVWTQWEARWEAHKIEAHARGEARMIGRLWQEKTRQVVRDLRSGKKVFGDNIELLEAPESPDAPGAQYATKEELETIGRQLTPILQSAAHNPQLYLDVERRVNLEQIGEIAVQEASEDSDGTADTEPIDPDWFAQWRNRAQDVSNEQMQRLWARVLKGEVKSQGSFSIRTMDLLVQLSQKDAELIAKLGSFVLNAEAVYRDSKQLKAAGLSLIELVNLNELGIISDSDSLKFQISASIQKDGSRLLFIHIHGKVLICYPKKDSIAVRAYPVTQVGRELLTLASFTANEKYLLDVANAVRKSCSKIEIADIVSKQDGGIHYRNAKEI